MQNIHIGPLPPPLGGISVYLYRLSKLDKNHRKILFQIFISAEVNDKMAVKWRFYQYLKYHLGLNIKTVKVNRAPKHFIDFIIETEENEKIFGFSVLNKIWQ